MLFGFRVFRKRVVRTKLELYRFFMDACFISLLYAAVKCYQCHEIDDPANCTNLVECPSMDHVSELSFVNLVYWLKRRI